MKTTEDNDSLIANYIQLDAAIRELQEQRGRIEWELTRRMQGDGATAIPHETHEVALTATKVTYEPAFLTPLLELVSVENLIYEKAYSPEHQETVPAKWNATKLKPFRKYGADVAAIIDGARVEGPPKLTIKEKK
jgi:hypothetical protein